MATKRIGILTSGGDCPGLNAVIRGAVKACNQLGYDCVGFLKGYEGLHDPVQYVHLTPDSTRGILNQGGTILGSTNKGRFAATVGVQDRQELAPHLIDGVKQTIAQLGIDGLICVGGDGSLAVAQQFHEQGIPVVGVPKTIDNDLSATAFTFGFDSAIECATDALDRLHTTAASHERIMVLEVMGRHAGWIALHAGIAGGGDVILIPEIGWSYEHLCHKILHRESQGKKFTLVVVAEGAELPGGELVGESRNGQQMKLGGVGRAVAEEIERRLHRETRLSVLGHLQRGGNPTTFDRVLATQFGAHAVRLVKEGRFGEMICSQPPEMTSVPIIEAVNVLRRVDPHGPAVQAARALGISFGDRAADEIGHDVFDRLNPVSHVVIDDATHAHLETGAEPIASAPRDEEANRLATAESSEAPELPCEEPTEADPRPAEETPLATTIKEAIEEPLPSREPSSDAEVAEPVTPPTDEANETAAPTIELRSESVLESAPDLDADDLDTEAAESVAETVLDMAAEADAAAHGVTEPAEEETSEPVTQPEVELPVTDTSIEPKLESATPTTEQAGAEPASPLEAEPTETAALELDEAPAAPASDLQSDLAAEIARAAKDSRESAPGNPEIDAETSQLTVADLVQQKLAAAAATVQTPVKPAGEPLEAPADQPHEEDLVAEAREALTKALGD